MCQPHCSFSLCSHLVRKSQVFEFRVSGRKTIPGHVSNCSHVKRVLRMRRSKPLLADDKPLRTRARKPRDPAQPHLPFDPMPARVEPCLALLKPRPPIGSNWLHEIKWDLCGRREGKSRGHSARSSFDLLRRPSATAARTCGTR